MSSIEDRLAPVVETAAANAAAVDHDAAFPEQTVKALADAGLLGITLPAEVGGLGLGPAQFLTTVRRLAGACASSAMVYLMHVCAAQVAQAGGAPEDRLRGMAADRLSTLAFSERGSRSHFWAPVSQIEGGDGDERLAAQKSFVTSAGQASTYVVSTRPAGADALASSLYLVPGDAVGSRRPGRGSGSACAGTPARR